MANEDFLHRLGGAAKGVAVAAYNGFIGDDIATLRDPKKPTWEKALAVADIASNCIPEGALAKMAGKFVVKEVVEHVVVHEVEHLVERNLEKAGTRYTEGIAKKFVAERVETAGELAGERAVRRLEHIPFAGLKADAAASLRTGMLSATIRDTVKAQTSAEVRSVLEHQTTAQGRRTLADGLSKPMQHAVEKAVDRGVGRTVADGTKDIALREAAHPPTTSAGKVFAELGKAHERVDRFMKPAGYVGKGLGYVSAGVSGYRDPGHAAEKAELHGAAKTTADVSKGAANLAKITSALDRVLHVHTSEVLGYARTAATLANVIPEGAETAVKLHGSFATIRGGTHAHEDLARREATPPVHQQHPSATPHAQSVSHAPTPAASASHAGLHAANHNHGGTPPSPNAITPWNGHSAHSGTIVHRNDEHAHMHVGRRTYVEFRMDDARLTNAEAMHYNHIASVDRTGVVRDHAPAHEHLLAPTQGGR